MNNFVEILLPLAIKYFLFYATLSFIVLVVISNPRQMGIPEKPDKIAEQNLVARRH